MQHIANDGGVAACIVASDHVTRILKEYGDALDKYHMAPEKADISKELRVLRCVLLLIELTGALISSIPDLQNITNGIIIKS